MKIQTLVTALAVFTLLSLVNHANAQTQFIKYKKYLIPVNAECPKPKVIISTDLRTVGGVEDDDIQSMVHYLVSSYRFNTRGLISTPSGGTGSKADIITAIDSYSDDRTDLVGSPARPYPLGTDLKAITVQGDSPGNSVPTYNSNSHAGAKRIRDEVAEIVNNGECGPLYVLVWGAITDLAIALNGSASESISNDEIAEHLRVYFIGSSNQVADLTSWNYVKSNFLDTSKLWLVQSGEYTNSATTHTFRGMHPSSNYQDRVDLKATLSDFGCLGSLLSSTSTDPILKLGDTPSVLYLMDGNRTNPESPSWGGQYKLRAGTASHYIDDVGPSSVSDHLGGVTNGIPDSTDSVYGAWYEDMSRAGTTCP